MGINSSTDEKWMALAIEQAKKAEGLVEVPVGAVLVQDDEFITQAHNQPISTNDPTAHAEIELLRLTPLPFLPVRWLMPSIFYQ